MLFYPFRTKGSLSPRKEVILLPKPPQDCLCYLDYVETTGVGGVVQKISDFTTSCNCPIDRAAGNRLSRTSFQLQQGSFNACQDQAHCLHFGLYLHSFVPPLSWKCPRINYGQNNKSIPRMMEIVHFEHPHPYLLTFAGIINYLLLPARMCQPADTRIIPSPTIGVVGWLV